MNNGFSFANFGAGSSPEQFDAGDLAQMFGASACVDGTIAPCIPTAQAAAWARMVNDARQSGHCEGLVVQASVRFNNRAQPSTAELPRDADVIHGVFRAFATQFLPEVQDSARKWSGRSLVEIVNELTASLKDGTADHTMGLYSEQGGHAVLPYAVTFSSDTMAVVKVYDSNWPGMERYVVVDFVEDKWFFSFSGRDQQADDCVWSGGPGDIDLTPLASRTSAQCPFCGDKSTVTKSMLLIRSSSSDWSVTTDKGTFTPANSTAVDGITSRAIRTATCEDKTRLPEFLIAADSYRVSITLPDDSSAYVSNGESMVEIVTTGRKQRKPIVIDRGEVLIEDADTTTTVSNGNLAAVVQAPQAVVALAEDSIEVTVGQGTGAETVVVDRVAPSRSVDARGDGVVVADASGQTSTVVPTVPESLRQEPVLAGLPPASERDLANAQYLEQIATSTTTTTPSSSGTVRTTVPATTTTAPRVTGSTVAPTTTTVPTATVRIIIEDGEGGVRFGSTGDSYGSPSIYLGNDSLAAANCGPANATLCDDKTYAVPIGWDFSFDWTLYADQYLFEMQCGSGTSWSNPQSTYGSGSEVRWIGQCTLSSVQSNQTITLRQR